MTVEEAQNTLLGTFKRLSDIIFARSFRHNDDGDMLSLLFPISHFVNAVPLPVRLSYILSVGCHSTAEFKKPDSINLCSPESKRRGNPKEIKHPVLPIHSVSNRPDFSPSQIEFCCISQCWSIVGHRRFRIASPD